MSTILEQAVALIRAGNTEKAKQLLADVIQKNPRDENAWLWMVRCVHSEKEKRYCFERVLNINPQNKHAIEGIRRLDNPISPKTEPKKQVGQPSSASLLKATKKPKNSNFLILLLLGTGIIGFVCVCGIFYARLTSRGLTISSPTSTPLPPLKPLVNLAMTKAEIETELQVLTPLQEQASPICDNSGAVECFSSGFISNDGDVFVLVLESRLTHDEAFDYGIARQVQLKQVRHASDIDIPTTSGNFRWLMLSFVAGEPVYHGGATADNVAIYMIWSRSSLIFEEEAVQAFSRLLDRQIAKIKRGRQ